MSIKILNSLGNPLKNLAGMRFTYGDTSEDEVLSKSEVIDVLNIKIPIINANQLVNDGGVANIKSIYDMKTITNIGFHMSSIYGTEELPIYHHLNISIFQAIHKNNVLMIHSSLLIPEIFTPPKPSSPLPIYANQSAMLTNQGSQVSGQYYAYTGSTSMWLYNGVATGLITNYTELVAVVGWQEWGTQPSWLKITGTYLVGANNINYLDFTFWKSKPGNILDFNFVELVITSRTNGNLDPLRIEKLHTIISLNYNQYEETVTSNGLDNVSIYGELYDPIIINPATANYRILGGGNYALEQGYPAQSNQSSTLRARVEMTQTPYLAKFWDNETVCVITRLAMVPSGVFTNRGVFSNRDDVNFLGFSFEILSTGFRFNVGNGTSFNGSSSSAITPLENDTFYVFIGTYRRVGGTSTFRYYWKSLQNNIPFTFLNEVTTANVRDIRSKVPTLHFSRANTTSSMDPVCYDETRVLTYIPSDIELEAIAIQLDGPNFI
jgi:hypothetical protein